jgi:hypothetical protein
LRGAGLPSVFRSSVCDGRRASDERTLRPRTDIGPGALLDLLFGAVRLDTATYRRVAENQSTTRLCLAIVLLSGLAHGAMLAVRLEPVIGPGLAGGSIIGVAIMLASLALSSCLVWLLGAVVFRYPVTFGRVLRPLAISSAPALFNLVGTVLSPRLVMLVVALWLLMSFVVAVRAALGSSWLAAGLIAVGAWIADLALYGYAIWDR